MVSMVRCAALSTKCFKTTFTERSWTRSGRSGLISTNRRSGSVCFIWMLRRMKAVRAERAPLCPLGCMLEGVSSLMRFLTLICSKFPSLLLRCLLVYLLHLALPHLMLSHRSRSLTPSTRRSSRGTKSPPSSTAPGSARCTSTRR